MALEILPQELSQKLEEQSITALDVREPWEYEEYNIDTQNMSLYDIPNNLDQLIKFKDIPIVVFCRTGARGVQAQKFLAKQGFTQVMNLKGGIEAYLQHN